MTDIISSQKSEHIAVLGSVAPEAIITDPNGVYVDATFGRGGHSRKILQALSPVGRLIAFDRDVAAVDAAKSITDRRFTIVHGVFSAMKENLQSLGVTRVTGILMDIGVSSPQIDEAARGFSFRFDGPLDMRMDQSAGTTAAEWINTATQKDIETVLKEDGEEKFASRIASEIIKVRKTKRIERTQELADLIARVVPKSKTDAAQHPATRSFQGIRIHINRELEELKDGLDAAGSLLSDRGRLGVISFHSLEDRIVKNFFSRGANPAQGIDRRIALKSSELPPPLWTDVKRIKPDQNECDSNPRARSAVMRVASRTAAPWQGGVR